MKINKGRILKLVKQKHLQVSASRTCDALHFSVIIINPIFLSFGMLLFCREMIESGNATNSYVLL